MSFDIHTTPLPKPFEGSLVNFGVTLSDIDIQNVNGTTISSCTFLGQTLTIG
jgi:hypothetical protein